MSLETRALAIADVIEITPKKFADERGFFSETWNEAAFAKAGIDVSFVQDNHSLSIPKGVVRGLHYQLPPFAQDKLIRVVRGAIIDVAVDIRRSSPSFGQWVAAVLNAEKWNQLLVPKGFAHGFATLTENTEVVYKVSAPYSKAHDRSIRFDDPAIGINWGFDIETATLSEKDANAPLLAEADLFD